MQCNLFYSNTFRGVFDSLTKKIKENGGSSFSHIVIVPDRFSLTVEKAILDKLKIAGSMNITVVNFDRLSALLTGKNYEFMSDNQAIILMADIIGKCETNLNCYRNITDYITLSGDLLKTITLLRDNRITPEMIEENAKQVSSITLKHKMLDIAIIYRAYITAVALDFYDMATVKEKLTEIIPNSEKVANAHIYITDFYSFNAVEYKIIEKLILNAITISIGMIEAGKRNINKRIYPKYKILPLLEKLDIRPNIYKTDYSLDKVNTLIERSLFSNCNVTCQDAHDKIELKVCGDIECELVAVARRIHKLVAIDGYRYLNISVVCCNLDEYEPYIERIFKRFEIPVFIDKSEPLSKHPLISLILSLFKYIISGMPTYLLSDIIKNPLIGINYSVAECFDNYIYKYSILWHNIRTPFKKGNSEEIESAEYIRLYILAIVDLIDNNANISNGDYIEAIERILNVLDIDKKLDDLYHIQEKIGDDKEKELTKQVLKKLTDITNGVKTIAKGNKTDINKFFNLISACLNNSKISMIPQYYDCVVVGEPTESRFGLVDALFVVGASESYLPRARNDNGILTSSELIGGRLDVNPTIQQFIALDKLLIHQLIIKAEKQLYISYSTSSYSAGKYISTSPSVVINEIAEMFGLEICKVEDSYRISSITEELEQMSNDIQERARLESEKIATPTNAMYEFIHFLRANKKGKVIDSDTFIYDALYSSMDDKWKAEMDYLNSQNSNETGYLVNALALLNERKTSVSRLECFYACPFKYYAKYGLCVSAREKLMDNVYDYGLIVHMALELYVNRIIQLDCKCIVDKRTQSKIIDEVLELVLKAEKFGELFDDEYYRGLILADCTRYMLETQDLIDNSDFKPVQCEATIGECSDYPPIELDINSLGKIRIQGKIDRIDKLDDKAIIVDYKTGSVTAGYMELYLGSKLQLFIYMNALKEAKNECYGVQYLKFKNKMSTEQGNTKYVGFSKKDFYPDEHIFDNMMDYAIFMAKKAVENINKGYILARPLKSSCEYCEYKPICSAKLVKPKIRKFPANATKDLENKFKEILLNREERNV